MGSSRDELERVVRQVIAPLLRADGAEVYLIAVTDSEVRLHVKGHYSGCPGLTLTKRRVIEPAIQAVAPEAQVDLSSGAIVPPDAERLEE
ncbi:MAG: NifU family protein [Myxococcales bacterium]|nr:NifU family protein [Myxococcales bacterium]MCB9577509.1 NifU family protein [Polyangiaceae bacterium]